MAATLISRRAIDDANDVWIIVVTGLPTGGITNPNKLGGTTTVDYGVGSMCLQLDASAGSQFWTKTASGNAGWKVVLSGSVVSAVSSVFTRTGAVVAAGGDYTAAQVTGALVASNNLSDVGIAATALANLGGAPIASPTFTGVPALPTAAPGTNTTQAASTAFVTAAVAAAPGGVTSVFTRTGAVVKQSGDYAVADVTGAAPLASPTFTGVPAAPTPGSNVNTTQVVTGAWVNTYFATLASPALTGTPTVPTAAIGTNTTQIATTAFVNQTPSPNLRLVADANYAWGATDALVGYSSITTARVVTLPTGASVPLSLGIIDLSGGASATNTISVARAGSNTINGGTANVVVVSTAYGGASLLYDGVSNWTVVFSGYAPLVSPVFTGIPVAPTAAPGTNTTQIATTAFVTTSFAPLASPALTGTPTAPTAAGGTNTTQIATTALVHAAIQASMGANLLNTAQSNTSITPPADAKAFWYRGVGSGGGGGGGGGGAATAGGGGGGGAGMFGSGLIWLADIGSPATLFATVGAGGTAGAAGGAGGNGNPTILGLTTGPANIILSLPGGQQASPGTTSVGGNGGQTSGTPVSLAGATIYSGTGGAGSYTGIGNAPGVANSRPGGAGAGGGAVVATVTAAGGVGGGTGGGTGGTAGGVTGGAANPGTDNSASFSQTFLPDGAGGGGGGSGTTTGGAGGNGAKYGGGGGGGGAGVTTGGVGGAGGVGALELIFI